MPGKGWVTVEATPPAGMPQPTGQGKTTQLLDYFKYKMQQIMAGLQVHGVKGLMQWFADCAYYGIQWLFSAGPVSMALKSVVLLGLMSCFLWRWIRKGWGSNEGDGKVPRFRHLLERMDKHLKNYGIVRPTHQTLHQFARRIRDEAENCPHSERVSEWYREYAEVRYGEPLTEEALEFLRNAMPETE